MEVKLLYLQFLSDYNTDPKLLDNIIQRNCSQMPHKYVYICQEYLNVKRPFIDKFELISDLSKCYKEHRKESNIYLSPR